MSSRDPTRCMTGIGERAEYHAPLGRVSRAEGVVEPWANWANAPEAHVKRRLAAKNVFLNDTVGKTLIPFVS